MDPAVITALIGAVPVLAGAWLTWKSGKAAAHAQETQAIEQARGPEWSAFYEQMNEWTGRRFEELSAEIASNRSELQTLRGEVKTLREVQAALQAKYASALGHIRVVEAHLPEGVVVEPPEAIRDDL